MPIISEYGLREKGKGDRVIDLLLLLHNPPASIGGQKPKLYHSDAIGINMIHPC